MGVTSYLPALLYNTRFPTKNTITIPANTIAICAAVSKKKPSGTMLMSMSVRGSRTHRSLLKKILWKTIKYFVKSVDIMPIKTKATAKTAPVPRW